MRGPVVSSPRPAWLVFVALGAVPLASLVYWGVIHEEPRAARAPGRPSPEGSVPARPAAVAATALTTDRSAPPAPSNDGRERAVAALLSEARGVQRSDPKRSRALLRQALSLDPENEPALTSLSGKLLADESHDEARALAARCVAAHPENETCSTVLNYALPRGPEIDELTTRTAACLSRTPDDAKCLATMVGVDVLDGKLGEASKLAETLERVDPEGKGTLLSKARLASASGNYEDARRAFDAACTRGMEQACFRAEALRGEGF